MADQRFVPIRCALAASALALAATASASSRAARSARIIACAAARSEGSDSGAMVTRRWNHIRQRSAKPKPSSDRCRPPRLLRMSPIDAGQQITELRRRDRHHAVGRARPQEAAPLQALREQAGALAVMPDHLQQIAAAAAEAKQMAAQRIAPQHLLHLQAPATESPSACRCGRSPATPARRSGTGSSRPSIGQRRDCCRQRRRVDRARDPHPRPGRKLDLDRPAAGRCWRRCRAPIPRSPSPARSPFVARRHRSARRRNDSPPPEQQRSRNAVSPRRRRDLPRRLQALQHDLELLILGPAPPPARLHHFEPFDLGTALITVHKDSSQHCASPGKAAFSGGIRCSNSALASFRTGGLRDGSLGQRSTYVDVRPWEGSWRSEALEGNGFALDR